MNSDWLGSFLVFSKTLNFTKAANELHISQPALHVKIKKLSEFIGRPLYEKIGRNLLLTKEGEDLRSFALQQNQQTSDFLAELRGESITESISLIAGEGTYRHVIGEALSTFIKNTNYELQIRVASGDAIINSVISSESQLGIAPLTFSHDSLKTQKLYTVEQKLILHKTHPLAKKRSISIKDINGEQLIVPTMGKPHRIMIDRMLMDAGIKWKPSIEADGWDLITKFVSFGMGLAIVNSYCELPKNVVSKPLRNFPKIDFYLIERKSNIRNAALTALKSILLKTVQDKTNS